ncbi:iron ABC transporter permease [Tsukamurella tyrosinosolvens]|uniref:ABC transporter permease n=1 Tax=Tsukamurella tyrosinosolvens TaxID=57704 RepID=UPI00159EE68F|nr:iron ABC transporter permease [Tsukamurella tyrosinosolvens]
MRLLTLAAAALAAVAAVPLGFVVYTTIDTGWAESARLVFRPRVAELLSNTVLLTVIAVPLSVIVGVGGAWLVERTALWGRRAWSLLLAAPLAIPAFVGSYGWVSAIPSLGGLWSGVLIAVLFYYPLVYIPVAAALSRLDPALEESAAALGLGRWAVFARVVLPQLRLAALGGAVLVALHLLAEYGAFAMIRFDTFTTAIMVQYQSTFNGTAGSMLAGVLALLCLFLLLAEVAARGRARYARVGSGAVATPERIPLGGCQAGAQLALLALVGAALGLPLWFVVRWTVRGAAQTVPADLLGALGTSLGYGAATAVLTVAAAFPLAYLAVRRPNRITRTLEASTYVSSAMPGIVIGLALVTVSIRALPDLYQSATVLILAYVLLFLPRAAVGLRAGLAQAPVSLEEAARALGAPPPIAFARITLRLTAPASAAGAALVFLAVTNELTATLILAPNGTRTLATEFWAKSSEIDYAGAAPYALAMVLLSLPTTYLLFRQSRRAAGRTTRTRGAA